MHCPRIPEHKVPRIHLRLNPFTSPVFEPFQFLFLPHVSVALDPAFRGLRYISRLHVPLNPSIIHLEVFVFFEVLAEKVRAPPHHHETTIIRTIGQLTLG